MLDTHERMPPAPPELATALAEIRAGLPYLEVLVKHGHRRDQIDDWLARGRTEEDTSCAEFAQAVDSAAAAAEVNSYVTLATQAKTDWRAALQLRQTRMQAAIRKSGRRESQARRGAPPPAEAAENEYLVWEMTRDGATNQDIADALGIDIRSVSRIRRRTRERYDPKEIVEEERDRQLAITDTIIQESLAKWDALCEMGIVQDSLLQRVLNALDRRRKVIPGVEAPMETTPRTDSESPQHMLAQRLLDEMNRLPDEDEEVGERGTTSTESSTGERDWHGLAHEADPKDYDPLEVAELPPGAGDPHDNGGWRRRATTEIV